MKTIIYHILYRPMYNLLMFFVWLIPGHNVGVAIIMVTILIRLALLPSSNNALRKQKHMRDLQPKIDALKEKYKGDQQGQAKAMMDLYRDHKVSPWGSCLPLLIQMPILFVLYYVFRVGLDKSRFDMIYPFLPKPEMINTHFLGIDLAQPERWVLPILTGVTQYIQMRQMQVFTAPLKPGAKDMASMMSKQMMLLMPVMSVIIAMQLPAALPIYWIVTTVFAIGQQWLFIKKMRERNELAPVAGSAEPSSTEGANGEVASIRKIGQKLFKKKDVVVTVRRKGE